MNALKKIFRIVIILAAVGAIIYFGNSFLLKELPQLQQKYFPCQKPITYSIGSFDNKFGISKSEFLSAIGQAGGIWESAINKKLFEYDSSGNGELKINLIYDYRQEATVKLKNLGITLHDDLSTYNQLKSKYDSLKSYYTSQKSQYDALVQDFNNKKAAYESKVSYWNNQGGAPPAVYAELNQEKNALDAQAEEVNKMQNDLNSTVDNINALATTLNRLSADLNLGVQTYNTVGNQRGGEFEEGDYRSDSTGQAIDIFQFDDRQKLIRVLAHELGHALGLEHLDNPSAIMYKFNQGENIKLTADDINALKTLCNIK